MLSDPLLASASAATSTAATSAFEAPGAEIGALNGYSRLLYQCVGCRQPLDGDPMRAQAHFRSKCSARFTPVAASSACAAPAGGARDECEPLRNSPIASRPLIASNRKSFAMQSDQQLQIGTAAADAEIKSSAAEPESRNSSAARPSERPRRVARPSVRTTRPDFVFGIYTSRSLFLSPYFNGFAISESRNGIVSAVFAS